VVGGLRGTTREQSINTSDGGVKVWPLDSCTEKWAQRFGNYAANGERSFIVEVNAIA
jgi:hypothetical protein